MSELSDAPPLQDNSPSASLHEESAAACEFRQLKAEFAELRNSVERGRSSSEPRRASKRTLANAGLFVCLGVVVASSTSWAASLACTSGLPFCFQPGEPARASKINGNFDQLSAWLQNKLGPLDQGALTVVNDRVLQGTANDGTVERFLWPRAANNGTYLNFGSRGLFIRDNSSQTAMSINSSLDTTFTGDVSVPSLSVDGLDLDGYIQSYLETHCSISLGFRDSCDDVNASCALAGPTRYATGSVNHKTGSASSLANYTGISGGWIAMDLTGINNGDEILYASFHCD